MTSLNDYSKWRNFGDDDSDDERPRGMPRVTRLDGTQSITIGPPPATRTATSVRADEVNAKPAGSKRPADALDYSRWDQLQVDDSDGDDDDNEYDGYGNVIPKHLLQPKGDAGDDFAAHAANTAPSRTAGRTTARSTRRTTAARSLAGATQEFIDRASRSRPARARASGRRRTPLLTGVPAALAAQFAERP